MIFRIFAFGLAALIMCHGLADAQSTGQGGDQKVQTQSRHKAKVKKIDALTLKQSNKGNTKSMGNTKWGDIELKR